MEPLPYTSVRFLQLQSAKYSSIQNTKSISRKMMETQSITNSVPIEPDRFVRRITKSQVVVILVLSIIACWVAQETLASLVSLVPGMLWLAFHVAYLGFLSVLFYRSFKSSNGVYE